jgi:hypothetical protein
METSFEKKNHLIRALRTGEFEGLLTDSILELNAEWSGLERILLKSI